MLPVCHGFSSVDIVFLESGVYRLPTFDEKSGKSRKKVKKDVDIPK